MTAIEAPQASKATETERELALQVKVRSGYQVESLDEMTPRYRDVLVQTMLIAADLEMTPMGYNHGALANAPTLDAKIALASAIQDELGHAQITYRLLEDFGFDTRQLLFERPPGQFRTFYMTQHPIDDYISAVVMMMLGDRAGYTTTLDIEESCSYAPYARSLRKVNFEETFHVGHGERLTEFFWKKSPETRRRVQDAVDLYFPMAVTWFGVPDHLKSRTDQLTYRIRGQSNDELRQRWLAKVVPFCERVGIRVPAHFDSERNQYALNYDMPILLDEASGKWSFDTATWDQQFVQWKKGGPLKTATFERMQAEIWGCPVVMRDDVVLCLEQVHDPHVPVSIRRMGMLERVDVDDSGAVAVGVKVPCLGCPAAQALRQQVDGAVRGLVGVSEVRVDLIWGAGWRREDIDPAVHPLLRQFGLQL